MSYKQQVGLTLIELMIGLVIIGILVAIAVPSYQDSIRKEMRMEMKSKILDISEQMNAREVSRGSLVGFELTDLGAEISKFPSVSNHKYTLTLSPNVLTNNSWEIAAKPVVGSSQASDGVLRFNHKGWSCWDGEGDCTLSNTSQWD